MAAPLRLFVGLGNPGRRYAATRHNAGAWFVERLARALSLEFRSEARFASLVARGRAPDGGDFRLALPQSYMNESGQPVAALARALAPWPQLATGDTERAMLALHTRPRPSASAGAEKPDV